MPSGAGRIDMPVNDKAGYKRERSYILDKWGVKVKTCHVADIRRELGLTRGSAPNRIDATSVTNPCPPECRDMVLEAVREVERQKR